MERVYPGAFDQARHHPAGATLKPGNIEQPLVDAWKNWQLAQVLPDL